MHNQKGEVVTGVMVAMMVIMMLFGGMHWMHGDHRNGNDHDGSEHRQNHHQHGQQKENMHHMHNDEGGHADTQADTQKESK